MINKKQIKLLTEVIRKETVKILAEAKEKAKKRKKAKKPKLEGLSVSGIGMCEVDDIGNFFVVMNPGKGSAQENIIFETDAFNLSEKISKGIVDPQNIKGMFKKQGAANKMGNKLLKEREASILAAKNKAESAINLKGEIVAKADQFKKTKFEAEQAAAKLNESKKRK